MAYRVGVRVDKQNHGLQLEERVRLTSTFTGVGIVFFFLSHYRRNRNLKSSLLVGLGQNILDP